MTKCCFFLKTCCLCRRKSRIFTTLKKPTPPSPCNCVTLIPVCWVSLKFHLKCLFLPSETRRYLTMFHCNHQHWPWDPGPHMLLQWGVNWLNNNQLFLFNTNHAVNEELFHLLQLWTHLVPAKLFSTYLIHCCQASCLMLSCCWCWWCCCWCCWSWWYRTWWRGW